MKNFFKNLLWGGKTTTATVKTKDTPVEKGKNIVSGVHTKGALKKQKIGQKVAKTNIRRTKSIDSVSNNTQNKLREQPFGSRMTAMNGTPSGQSIYDVSAYLIVCPKHKRMAVCMEEKSGYVWLPFISLPPTRTWGDGAIDGANIVLSNGDAKTYVGLKSVPVIEESFCLELFRLQLPQSQRFNIRLIYYIKLNQKNRNFKCCQSSKRLKWIAIEDLKKSKVSKLWGPEVVEFTRKLSGPLRQRINEYSLDEAFTYVPRDPPRNLEEEMLKSTNFTEKDVERLYTDFIEHCFPANFMTQTSFNDYMSKYGFESSGKKLEQLFKAFNFHKNSFLSFHEFLLGLTSIDPMSQNGQSRIKFVFKYFDSDLDGFLSERDFIAMFKEINPKLKDSELKKKVKDSMKAIGIKKGVGVHFDDFFKAVGAHKFRGTSSLCRSRQHILSQISRSMATRALKKSNTKSSLALILKERKYKGICQLCREKKYRLAIHSVRLNSEGKCVDAKPVIDNSNTSPQLTAQSRDIFDPKFVANYLIEQIRAFNKTKGSHKERKGLFDGSADKAAVVKKLEELCSAVEKIVVREDRCVKVTSPAFIIGDIHGNLEDLMTMEKVLWKSIPIVAANYVFLGDYVDRGQWGLECTLYLMCIKLLAPNKVILLRGNHEVRDLQKHYSYRKECVHKYGHSLGTKVFEITNRVFDKIPVCAVVDEAIYCAHGGIPCSTRLIDKINEVKSDLRDPEKESTIVWEILWSDPIGAQQFAETAELLQVRVETARGFLTNNKRGTAFLFGEEAVNNFLQNNGLTHIIRAHEVPAQGFTFHFGNKCTTIFSSSHYCGNNNNSACVHIDNEKLRIVRLDTVNNAPAGD